jgi:hypothetical protein
MEAAYDRDPETDVCLSQLVTDEVGFVSQYLLELVKGFEKRNDCVLVCSLALREAGFVHAV